MQSRGCLQSITVSCNYQVTVTTTPKAHGDLVGCNSPDCLYDYVYTYTLIDCTFSSTGCDGYQSSGSVYDMFNATHNGGGPKLGNNPIIGISVSDDQKHILALNRISNRPGGTNPLRDRIDLLVTALSTATTEKGLEVRKGPNGTYIDELPFSTGVDYTKFGVPVITTILYLHLHHNSTFLDEEGQENVIDPVPSGDDFFAFARAYDELDAINGPDKDNLTSMIVTRNGVYAMRIDDPQGAIDFSTNIADNKEMQKDLNVGFHDNITEKGRSEAKAQCNGCSPQELKEFTDVEVEKAFIEYMQYFNSKYHTGIKVFKGVLDPSSGNYVWTKIID